MDSYITRILGLARRAGYLVTGTALVRDSVRGKRKPFLVMIASDASDNTVKRISDSCAYYKTTLARLDVTGDELAAILGKESSVMCVALFDEGMSAAITGKLDKTMFIRADNGESVGGRA